MNSIFTEENLLAFTTAARFGSFSKAAAELGVTTSAISYTIKRMETGWTWCCLYATRAALS